jgi:hypothetical protein
MKLLGPLIAICLFPWVIVAQQTSDARDELWPELDVYVPINEKYRLVFTGTVSKARETRDSFEGQLGAHVDHFFNDRITLRVDIDMVFRWDQTIGFVSTESSLRNRFARR